VPEPADRPVDVVDLRAGAPERDVLLGASHLDLADRAPDDRLIIVAGAAELVDLHPWFVRAATAVRYAVCVAVGAVDRAGGRFELRQSAAVTPPWGTLWVGGDRRVRWAAGSDLGSDVGSDARVGGLDHLLGVLGSPEVFDALLARLGAMPYRTASPAIELVRAAGGVGELRSAQAIALRALAAGPVPGGAPALPLPSTTLPVAVTALVPTEPALAATRESSRRALARAGAAVARLRGPAAPFVAPAGVPRLLAAADAAVAAHRDRAAHLLTGLQARVEGRSGDVSGLPAPVPVDDAAVAEGLRAAVTEALTAGSSLPQVAAALRATAREHGEAPVARARTDVLALDTDGARLGGAPDSRLSAATGAALGAAALVTTAVAAALPSVGIGGGVALTLVWVLCAGLLVARLPRTGRVPTGDLAAVSIVTLAAVVGVLVGGLLLTRTFAGVSVPVAIVLAAVLVLVAVAATRATWHTVVTRWFDAVPLDDAADVDARLTAIVDATLAGPYRQALGRVRVSEAAALLAVGLTDIADTYRVWADRLDQERRDQERLDQDGTDRDQPDGDRPGSATPGFRVAEVVRADLAAVAVAALEPSFDDVAAGAPLVAGPASGPSPTAELAFAYDAYIGRGSLHLPPPVVVDPTARARLTAGVWQQSGAARRLLTGSPRVPMTQLCGRHELRALDPDWRSIEVLRFAPAAVRTAVDGPTDDVLVSTSDVAGLLRLVPLRRGSVRFTQPTSGATAGDVP
jgi:hypothetical protein